MKRMVLILAVTAMMTGPVVAQDSAPEPDGELEEGLTLLEEGTRMLLRGLMREMEPAMDELREMLRDLDAYHAPEVLPNGDIIIRRKTPLTPDEEEGPVDL